MSDKHRESEPSHTLVFAQGSRECHRDKADRVRIKGRAYVRDYWFQWPQDEAIVSMIRDLCRGAFDAGRENAQSDLRRALGFDEAVREVVDRRESDLSYDG